MNLIINARLRNLCFLFLVSLFLGCASAQTNDAGNNDVLFANNLTPFGRTAIANGRLELIGSASHFGFRFRGRECRVFVSLSDWQDHNYLQYELDGVYQKRIRINKNTQDTPIVLTAPVEGNHTVSIFKATEPHTGPVYIRKVEGKDVRAILPSKRRIFEFIGNSITCGAAADPTQVPCGTGVYHDQHNAYYSYGPRVARALEVNYVLSSVSGIGVYRNWNSDGPTMPQVYEKTDFQSGSDRQWDFNIYQPTVISVALGTNDFSNGDGKKQRLPFDSTAFVRKYISFVQQVKLNYPNAQVVLLSSPMLTGEKRELLQHCLGSVKKTIDKLFPNDKPVAVHFFKPMQARGCTGHPSVEDHGIIAGELIPFFQKLIQSN